MTNAQPAIFRTDEFVDVCNEDLIALAIRRVSSEYVEDWQYSLIVELSDRLGSADRRLAEIAETVQKVAA